MNFLLRRSSKVFPTCSEEKSKSFAQMWQEAEEKMKTNPFVLDTSIFVGDEEQYAWVDTRLEELASYAEEEDDDEKNTETFGHWTSENLLTIDGNFEWVDARLEEMASRVEDDDDEAKNIETFSL